MAHTVNKIRRFGSVGRLSSGRWRARFSLPDGSRLSAPDTFDSKVEAWTVPGLVDTGEVCGSR